MNQLKSLHTKFFNGLPHLDAVTKQTSPLALAKIAVC